MNVMTVEGREPLRVREISGEAPWQWLAAGWRDLCRRPDVGVAYGVVVAAIGYAMGLSLYYLDALALFLPLGAGFAIVGPILAVGLYETSRRLQEGAPIRPGEVIFVAVRSPRQLAFIGVLLMIFMLAWVRIATLLFALFFGLSAPSPVELVEVLLSTADGLIFLALGTVIGAGFAIAAFALTAVSIPILMVRDVDAITAMIASINAVRRNFWPMMLWAWLIAVFTAIGVATFLIGLIVTFPLIGHATWHAYAALIEDA